MHSTNKSNYTVLAALVGLGFISLNSASATTHPSDVDGTAKLVRSAAGRTAERGDAPTRERSSMLETSVLTVERARSSAKSDSRTAAAVVEEAWIYDATVDLFDDFDGDGYFTYLRVSFDVDSIYSDHYVYARLFLTLDGVNWDEYHITDDFLVEGSSPFDDYEVETELVAGFPPGHYDALIEIYDADFGYFLGEFGPVQSSAFSLLPLEDIDNDIVVPAVVITTEHGGGGSVDLATLAAVVLFTAFALVQRRRRLKARTRVQLSSDKTL